MKLSESQLAVFVRSLIDDIEFSISLGKDFTEDDIDPLICNKANIAGFGIEDLDYKKIKNDIEYRFKIKHTMASCIFDDYDDIRDWYNKFQPEEEFFWNRYRGHLINNEHMDINSVNKLDSETLVNLMNCIGNPNDKIEGKRLRRGLVIGDVQSGKTATYAGLICKAADAGYKVVILLTGITETLRKQTQERMEEGVIGCTIRVDKKGNIGKKIIRVGVGLDNKDIRASAFTSYEDDFRGNVDSVITSLSSHRSLVLFIIKKNVSVLTKLHHWLTEQNKDILDDLIHEPMLLIDDEADNASINTKKDRLDPTKTNKLIRLICNAFNNASYVGFTATPFANVFIDPNTTEDMEHSDLFPEHFIYVLPTPSSYIGASKIFNTQGVYKSWIRYITDINEPTDEDIKAFSQTELINRDFYFKHTKEWCGILPDSLNESIYSFFIANAIRDYRGDFQQPRTMMVNMSRFVRVQNYIKEHIESLYKYIYDSINIDFSNDNSKNESLEVYKKFTQIWEKHYSYIGIESKLIINKKSLLAAIDKIIVIVINSAKNSDKLDYKPNQKNRVIAVGGLALSRGLTLKGLMVSYFYRNTSTYDVLLQMGRWFGYRFGYDDICQIWTSESSVSWYSEISRSTEELKGDLKKMFDDKLTPRDFGIRVRDESDELQITASNKMRNSFSVEEYFSFWGGVFETPYSSLNIDSNNNNLKSVKELVDKIQDVCKGFKLIKENASETHTKIANEVPLDIIKLFIENIQVSVANQKFQPKTILEFLEIENCDQLKLWDVALHSGQGDSIFIINNQIAIQTAKRDIYESNNHLCFTGRGVLGGNSDGMIGLDASEIELVKNRFYANCLDKSKSLPNVAWYQHSENRRPLLIIYFIRPSSDSKTGSPKMEKYKKELGDDPIIGFAVGFPANGIQETKSRKYKVNKTYMRLAMEATGEEDDDL